MQPLLPQYYRPSDEEFSELLKSCIFVFDTNVLLNLYRYPIPVRDSFLLVLEKLSTQKRIWLPFQVALEFQENRLTVIADQKNQYSKIKKILDEIEQELKTKLDKLSLKKRHATINPDELIDEISTAFQRYREQYDEMASKHPDVDDKDDLRERIDTIFDGNIGVPFSSAELETIYREGSERYKAKRPPGFADEPQKKGSYVFHKDLSIKQEYGDLIVWKEVIRFACEAKPAGVVFITDDGKEDWWLRVNGKTIGPRTELLSEFHDKTSIPFYMYGSDRFLSVIQEHIGIQVTPDTLTAISEIVNDQKLDIIVSELIYDLAGELINSNDELISQMAATNAFGYFLDDFEILDIDYDPKWHIIDFKAALVISGEQDEDKPYGGDAFHVEINGRAKKNIEGWKIQSYKVTDIESNWPDEFDERAG